MNSVITAIKNRTKAFFRGQERDIYKNSLSSLMLSYNLPLSEIELVLIDFGSTDTDYRWIDDLKIKTNLIVVNENFNLGKGRNIGLRASCGNNLFFLDADMIYPSNFFDISMRYLNEDFVYFPISFEEANREWQSLANGNVIVSKSNMDKIGAWVEKETWGGEDNDFFSRTKEKCNVKHEKLEGFIHQSHDHCWSKTTLKWS